MTAFFEKLDSKVTEYRIKNDICIDVIKNDTLTNLETKIDAVHENMKQIAERMKTVDAPRGEKNEFKYRESAKIDDNSNAPTLHMLEKRMDHLEDHSRRDNLLFYGFPEFTGENCAARVTNLINNKFSFNIIYQILLRLKNLKKD